MTNEEIVRRYSEAVAGRDHATAEQLRHPDWICDWPQSGERVTSNADMRAIVDRYPGGGWQSRERRTVGSEDEYVVTPAGTVVRVAGGGDVWTTEWVVIYADGSEWYVITIVELRDGRVRHETAYFAPPFEAPDWRRDWVKRLAPG
jgi:hypothetical protein